MEFGPIIYTITMILGISFIYLTSSWRKDFFDKEAAVIVVAIIISVTLINSQSIISKADEISDNIISILIY